jgi:hypothetical protein
MLSLFNEVKNSLTGLENSQFYPRISDMKSLSTAFRSGYILHTQLRFVLLDSFNFLDNNDRNRSISSCDIQHKRLFLLAKVKNGPLIGLIYDLNNLPTSRFEEENPIEIFHLPHDETELTISSTSLTALESKAHVSNLKEFFPLRLVHTRDYQKGDKEPDFVIQRSGKGKYISLITEDPDDPDSVEYYCDDCEFEKLEILEIQRRYLPKTLQQIHSSSSNTSELSDKHQNKRTKSNSFPFIKQYQEMLDSSADQYVTQMNS